MRSKTLFVPLLFSAILALGAIQGFSAEMDGVHFADSVKVDGHPLVLNGLGIRLATFLHIKVYVGALYLEKRSSDAAAILASHEIKRVELAFVRGVGAGKLRDAWPDDLKNNCNSGCEAYAPAIQKLQSLMQDMNSGDRMAFDFLPDRVDVWVKGKQVGTIQGPKGFPTQLLKDWIGNAPNDELKDGMLGKGNQQLRSVALPAAH